MGEFFCEYVVNGRRTCGEPATGFCGSAKATYGQHPLCDEHQLPKYHPAGVKASTGRITKPCSHAEYVIRLVAERRASAGQETQP